MCHIKIFQKKVLFFLVYLPRLSNIDKQMLAVCCMHARDALATCYTVEPKRVTEREAYA